MQPYIGEIRIFAGNFAPRGWAFCEGQLLAISQNQALFSLLGTTYGGDGRTTFALPDMRGRTAVHEGSGPGLTPRPLGQRTGVEEVTLNSTQIPSHSHTVTVTTNGAAVVGTNTDPANTNEIAGNALGQGSNIYNSMAADPGEPLGGVTYTPPTYAVNPTGGSQRHYNLQPFLVMRYIVALVGIFPSRS
ncbi:MAG: tail fiber protein [Bacteroidota bacterium]